MGGESLLLWRSAQLARWAEGAQQRARAKGSRDEAVPVGRTLFLWTPDGLGRSELAAQLARSGAQADGTARNWATVTRLAAMLDTGA